jgi:predicted HicB family RNase H-like nuclease
MAKIPPPSAKQSRKGAPPPLARTVGNLSKPEPSGQKTLNLRVPLEFKRDLKTLAAQQGTSMTELIVEAIGLLREQRGV